MNEQNIFAKENQELEERNRLLCTLIGRLVVECGVYKKALEVICFSESPDQFGIQTALAALNHAEQYLKSQGVKTDG